MLCAGSLLLLSTLFLLPAVPFVAAKEATLHEFARWEKDIAAFEEKDRATPPPKGALLFIGSSTIVRWKTLAQDFAGHQIINRGFGGNQIADSTHYAERMIFPYQPRMIFLRAGGNDIHAGKSPEELAADFKAFVEKVRTKLHEVEIVYLSISPAPVRAAEAEKDRAANALIAACIRQTPGTKYVETFDLPLGKDGQPREELFVADRLHFNPEGYKLLTERVRPFLPQP